MRKTLAALMAALFAMAPVTAQAKGADDTAALTEAQRAVEKSAERLAEAEAAKREADAALEAALAEKKGAAEALEAAEAAREGARDTAAASIRASYKLRASAPGLVALMLNAEDFNSFVSTVAALNAVEEAQTGRIDALAKAAADAEREADRLEAAAGEAERAAEEAQRAEEEARKASEEAVRLRDEAQRRAEAERARQEAEEARARAAAEPHEGAAGAQKAPQASVSGVDFSMGRDAFVAHWAPRIDRYLSGFPLAGRGRTFAEAAWDNGVDPRWSPAISNTESTRGRFCFRPHNAWGWGSSSWPDWDTAIRAHVKGLARGYGSTITPAAAKKYCPPTWSHWYSVTLAEMGRI